MKTIIIPIFLLLFLLHPDSASAIKLITNESNPSSSLTKDQIRDYYLKKNKQWPNGVPVRFFDHGDQSPERRKFLREIIERSQREIETYWIGQKLYTGHSAPTQVSSDSIMSSLVSRFPGAIGYVSDDFPLRKGIKEIQVKGD